MKDNWNAYAVQPYNSWDANQLQSYLTLKGEQVQKSAQNNRDDLLAQVKQTWSDTEDRVSESYSTVENWIFDTWSDSQLKAFLDRHGYPAPQPSTRDKLLAEARRNYQTTATQLGEAVSYPGNWLYATWGDSDLKAWCDERGIPVPQPSERDRLIAAVRRNARSAAMALSAFSASMAATAGDATQSISDAIFDTYSDSQLKKWADEHGIAVPQGSRRNEVLALVRRRAAQMNAQAASISKSAMSAYGAATSSAGNDYARATEDATLKIDGFKKAVDEYVGWVWKQLGLAKDDAAAKAEYAQKEAEKKVEQGKKKAAEASGKVKEEL